MRKRWIISTKSGDFLTIEDGVFVFVPWDGRMVSYSTEESLWADIDKWSHGGRLYISGGPATINVNEIVPLLLR